MKIGIVILSRFNSSRLPGKALMKIGDKKVLEFIIERLLQVVSQDQIVLATSDQSSDNPIEAFAKTKGVNCFRGSLDNVAERFYQAAKYQNWDYAIRINGDNIFLDTDVLDEMIKITKKGKYNFISNVKNRTFPKGMSVEVVDLKYYASILHSINASESYKEHVTLYLYEHDSDKFFYYYNTTLPEASGLQMALDTQEDFDRTQRIMSHFTQAHWKYNLKEIYNIWKMIENDKSI